MSSAAVPVTLSAGSLYTLGTARAFEHAARAGYDGVELLIDDRLDTRQPDYLKRLTEQYAVPILSVHSPFVAISGWPRDEIKRIERSVALAEAVGARTVNVHVPFRFSDLTISGLGKPIIFPFLPPPQDHRRYARWLLDGGLEALQARTPVTIAVENLPARRFLGMRFNRYALNTWEEIALIPTLCLDTTHCGTWDADPTEIYQRQGNRVKHVHLSDWSGRYQHQPLGTGRLALDRFLRHLNEHSYAGSVVVELTPLSLPVQDENKLSRELRRNVDFCRQHLGQGADESPAPTEVKREVVSV